MKPRYRKNRFEVSDFYENLYVRAGWIGIFKDKNLVAVTDKKMEKKRIRVWTRKGRSWKEAWYKEGEPLYELFKDEAWFTIIDERLTTSNLRHLREPEKYGAYTEWDCQMQQDRMREFITEYFGRVKSWKWPEGISHIF